MKLKLVPLILASATLLPGCFDEKTKDAETAADQPAVTKADAVASVNGTYIGKKTLDTLERDISERNQGQSFPKEQLVDELIQRELLIQEALKKHLDKSPEVVERLATVRNSLLSQAALQDYLKANPVTDEEIKAEYDSKMANTGSEYKARHILVKSEDEAKKIIAELEKGADFSALAKKYSIDPMGAEGGDLGWFTADRMVAPFSEAVVALENGKFTKQPVQTQFGWHIILREDSRALTPPPLDAVKDQIRSMLQRQKAQAFIEGLRKNAKIEVLLPPAQPVPTESKPTEAAEAAEPAEGTEQAEAKPAETAAAAESGSEPAENPAPATAEPNTAPAAQ